jgi:predicted TIM-barrel fold metal-dependent hydrolase
MVHDKLPTGACDCHTHVVGDVVYYPMVADRHYTPAAAPHEALLAHMAHTGIQRTVIVQPSFYGTDNRCMLDSLARLQGAGRGIAVVERGTDAASLRLLHDAGIRGLRVNVESAGVRDVQALEEPLRYWADQIADLGWHVQIYASHHTTAALAPVLNSLPVPVVLDHFAMVPAGLNAHDAQLNKLLNLLVAGNVYLKLSAPYRIAQTDPVVSATELAKLFLKTNPERILWGSDWPHTNREIGKAAHEVSRYRDIPSNALVESIRMWLPSSDWQQQVLVNNPARLYGF